MGSKKEMEFLDRMLRKTDVERKEVNNQLSVFFEDGERVGFIFSPGKDPFYRIFSTLRKDVAPQTLTYEQMLEMCWQIRDNVKQGKPDNIELNFIRKIQRSNGNNYVLDNTALKVITMDTDTPAYLFIRKGDVLNSMVFIGGNEAQAFLVTKGEDGVDSVLRLSEFHMLSISDNSTPEKEIGLLTSFSWINARVSSSIIISPNLAPVKNLLLAEGLRGKSNESQKSKAVKEERGGE